MSSPVAPTRMNLFLLRKRLKLAQRGSSLLQEKLDALLMNFYKYSREYKEHREKTIEQLSKAYDEYKSGLAVKGEYTVDLLSDLSLPEMNVEFEEQNIMGVKLPKLLIKDTDMKPNPPLSDSDILLEEAMKSLRETTPMLIKLAELEGIVLRLYTAIISTRKRVNALKEIVIPQVSHSVRLIELNLSERAREDFFRLKRIKTKLSKKKK